MLVIKAEIWPCGEISEAFEVGRMGIANISGLTTLSDYDVVALLDRDHGERVAYTRVLSHYRPLGWMPLTANALSQAAVAHMPVGDEYADILELLRKGPRV